MLLCVLAKTPSVAAKPAKNTSSMVPTAKQGPVRTDLTPRDKNECLAVAQTLYRRAEALSKRARQSVPREFKRVASTLDELCGEEDFKKAWISIEWMNGCLNNFTKDAELGFLLHKRRLLLRTQPRIRRLFAGPMGPESHAHRVSR